MAFLIPTWKRPVVTTEYTLGRVYPRTFTRKDYHKKRLNNSISIGVVVFGVATLKANSTLKATAITYANANIKSVAKLSAEAIVNVSLLSSIKSIVKVTSNSKVGHYSTVEFFNAATLNAAGEVVLFFDGNVFANSDLNASAIVSNDSIFYFFPSGGLTLGGVNDLNYITSHFACEGGFSLTNSVFEPVIFYGYFVVSQQFQWNVEANFEISLQSAWDVGNQILRYYQIEGQCTPPTCDTTGFDINDPKCDNGERMLVIIAATDLSDLCEKMQAQSLKWPIDRIRRWSRPARTIDIESQAAVGIDNTCNSLEDQIFCHVPECFDFCINEDVTVSLGMSAFLQDRFYYYSARGGLKISGFVDSNVDRNIDPSGGFTLGGAVDFKSSRYKYVASGGLILSSNADANADIWYYVGEGGLVLTGTIAGTKSPVHHGTAQGGLVINGTSRIRSFHHYKSSGFGISLAGTTPVSHASLRLASSGTLIIGGQNKFNSNRFKYTFNGGLLLAGQVKVKFFEWHYYPNSGLTLGGSPNLAFRYKAIGGVTLGGSAPAYQLYNMHSLGGFVLGGEILVTSSPTWHYSATGNLHLAGLFATNFHALGILDVEMTADSQLILIEPIYSVVNPGVPLPADTANINESCGCNPIPNRLLMSHNIDTSANLKDFLARNNLILPEKLNLIYNKFDGVWRATYHFAGIGSDIHETWTILFEWGCSSEIGSENLSTTLWKFSVLIKRVLNNEQVETRILYTFPTEPACSNEMIQFTFKINTQTKLVVLPEDLSIRDSIIYDNVGLFVGKNWEKNPNLNINIFENVLPTTEPTLDIKPIFPT